MCSLCQFGGTDVNGLEVPEPLFVALWEDCLPVLREDGSVEDLNTEGKGS